MADEKNLELIIKQAVDYWAGFLVKLKPEMKGLGEAMLLWMDPKSEPASEESIAKFKTILTKKIYDQIASGRTLIMMTVDYGPEGILREAVDEAGVNGNFLFKDGIVINAKEGKVQVPGALYPRENPKSDHTRSR